MPSLSIYASRRDSDPKLSKAQRELVRIIAKHRSEVLSKVAIQVKKAWGQDWKFNQQKQGNWARRSWRKESDPSEVLEIEI